MLFDNLIYEVDSLNISEAPVSGTSSVMFLFNTAVLPVAPELFSLMSGTKNAKLVRYCPYLLNWT